MKWHPNRHEIWNALFKLCKCAELPGGVLAHDGQVSLPLGMLLLLSSESSLYVSSCLFISLHFFSSNVSSLLSIFFWYLFQRLSILRICDRRACGYFDLGYWFIQIFNLGFRKNAVFRDSIAQWRRIVEEHNKSNPSAAVFWEFRMDVEEAAGTAAGPQQDALVEVKSDFFLTFWLVLWVKRNRSQVKGYVKTRPYTVYI